MAGFKATQHRVPQENSSASKGREAAEPPPAHSMSHAPVAQPGEQLHASGSSALTQSESLVSTYSGLKACGAQDHAQLLSNSMLRLHARLPGMVCGRAHVFSPMQSASNQSPVVISTSSCLSLEPALPGSQGPQQAISSSLEHAAHAQLSCSIARQLVS